MAENCNPMSKLSTFYNQVKKFGVLATNQFKVELLLPSNPFITNPLVTGKAYETMLPSYSDFVAGSFALEDKAEGMIFSVWVKGARTPGAQTQIAEFPYQGLKIQVPTLTEFESEYTLEFTSDASMQMRTMFQAWQQITSFSDVDREDGGSDEGMVGTKVSGSGTKFGTGKDGYVQAGGGYKGIWETKLRLTVFNQDHTTPVQSFILHGIFPSKVGEVTFSNESADIATFSVDFRYNYFTME